MAPEEFELGAAIDQRTTVYTLARMAWHFATRLTERADQFCGPNPLRVVLGHALELDPSWRFESVDAFATAWEAAAQPISDRESVGRP
jgi:serine/threonine-protein kinase